ncbi:head-tail adaptor protein [Halocynthiibacter sp. C4]|uniref:head-tail adaptor protein n=1 Tax=Halocynthiibacter sp. C4 TaxID=2992758 RepID=UPI00237B32F4|nr:head-tail adaptor protein [Halocynthiibacter sp. C4]MDE0589882.1 head-tail adaptor protein [Halocynthiibacter sp. C4]
MAMPELNRKLTLEAPVRVADGAGGYSETWQALGTLWAAIKFSTGREKAGDFVTVSTQKLRITVRAAPEGSASRPHPEQRFTEGARVYRILAVAEADSQGRYLTCTAEEEVVS